MIAHYHHSITFRANMFRSYQDLVRVPKKQDKPQSRQVYDCDLCKKGGWISENDVEIHRRDDHFMLMHEYRTKNADRFCTVCMNLMESNEELISHIKSQHLYSSPDAQCVEREIFICNECTHIFFNKDLLAVHIQFVHWATSKTDRKSSFFTCPKCYKDYRMKSIWFHFQQHEIPSVSLCDICLVNFPNRAELNDHIPSHQGHYICETCGYNGTKLTSYVTHLEEHAKRTYKPFKIPNKLLARVFKRLKPLGNQPHYNVHNALKGMNLPALMTICTLCRVICLSKREAKKHLWRDHFYEMKKKKHLCACGEDFFNKILLKQHVFKMKGLHAAVDTESTEQTVKVEYIESSSQDDSDDGADSDDWTATEASTSQDSGDVDIMKDNACSEMESDEIVKNEMPVKKVELSDNIVVEVEIMGN